MAQTQINGGTQIQANSVTSGQVASSIIVAGGGNAFTGNQSMGSNRLTNLATPTAGTDAVTKAYVDAAVQGLSVKVACQCATTSTNSFTIASGTVTVISGTSVDGYSPAVNDYILVKDAPASTGAGSANSLEPGNGIYIVTSNTTNLSLSRATFMSSTGDSAQGAFTFIESGTANASSGWVVSAPAADATCTYGTTNIQWTQFSGAGEITTANVIGKSGNQISVNTMATGTAIIGNAGTPTITTLGGDMSVGATGTVTIGAGAVTLSKMANLAANSVIGNTTGSGATPTAVSLTTGATASAVVLRDTNANVTANSIIEGTQTITTAAGTTTLTVSSPQLTQFTGTTTQTCVLPNATTLVDGQAFTVTNRSTGVVTVETNGAATLQTMAAASQCTFTVIANGTSAGTWDVAYSITNAGAGGGSVTSVSVVTANGLAGTVATATTTPAITLTTSVTGVLKGNGTAISAATSGTDYLAPATLFSGATTIAGYVVRETPSGTKNGSNTTFTLANTPISGSEMLFLNGVMQESGGGSFDYGISSGTITMTTAPQSTDVLYCTYWH